MSDNFQLNQNKRLYLHMKKQSKRHEPYLSYFPKEQTLHICSPKSGKSTGNRYYCYRQLPIWMFSTRKQFSNGKYVMLEVDGFPGSMVNLELPQSRCHDCTKGYDRLYHGNKYENIESAMKSVLQDKIMVWKQLVGEENTYTNLSQLSLINLIDIRDKLIEKHSDILKTFARVTSKKRSNRE